MVLSLQARKHGKQVIQQFRVCLGTQLGRFTYLVSWLDFFLSRFGVNSKERIGHMSYILYLLPAEFNELEPQERQVRGRGSQERGVIVPTSSRVVESVVVAIVIGAREEEWLVSRSEERSEGRQSRSGSELRVSSGLSGLKGQFTQTNLEERSDLVDRAREGYSESK